MTGYHTTRIWCENVDENRWTHRRHRENLFARGTSALRIPLPLQILQFQRNSGIGRTTVR